MLPFMIFSRFSILENYSVTLFIEYFIDIHNSLRYNEVREERNPLKIPEDSHAIVTVVDRYENGDYDYEVYSDGYYNDELCFNNEMTGYEDLLDTGNSILRILIGFHKSTESG